MECYSMGTKLSQGLQLPTLINPEKIARKPGSSMLFLQMNGGRLSHCVPASCHLLTKKGRFYQPLALKVSCSSEIKSATVLDSGSSMTSLDESKILKNKAEDVEPHLNGRCVYLVGMMGSGKTTVGKILAKALGYSFSDCDTLIEEAVGGSSVAEIFKLHGENFFRDNETEVLHKLSFMHRLIVSTGGGAVVRPINWRHMQKGISVWLDVPLEALARRITAVGTDSRPLLHHGSGDPYSKTMKLLTSLFEERGEAYANADVIDCSGKTNLVPNIDIAAKLGSADVCNLTPTVIAIEVLQQIENLLKKQG